MIGSSENMNISNSTFYNAPFKTRTLLNNANIGEKVEKKQKKICRKENTETINRIKTPQKARALQDNVEFLAASSNRDQRKEKHGFRIDFREAKKAPDHSNESVLHPVGNRRRPVIYIMSV